MQTKILMHKPFCYKLNQITFILYMMKHCCQDCNKQFETAQGLRRHMERKTPCVITVAPHQVIANQCNGCNRGFATASSLMRHARGRCRAPRTAQPATLETITQQMRVLQNMVATLGNPTKAQMADSGQAAPHVTNVNTINGPVTTVHAVTHVVNNVTIAPWGTPLQLTDADVEAALASIPCLAGAPAMTEVVAALMELVKRSHRPEAARNVHLNPKRADQALALTPTGTWAAMPLTEATAALFDGASARIAAPAGRRRAGAAAATVPVQYRADKALAVQLGLRPMEAHLANTRPGGPGPLLLESAAACLPADSGAAGVPAAAAATTQSCIEERVRAAILARPLRCSESGAMLVDWLASTSAAACLSPQDFYKALLAGIGGTAAGEAARLYAEAKSYIA